MRAMTCCWFDGYGEFAGRYFAFPDPRVESVADTT
jgi:hypothetical protein